MAQKSSYYTEKRLLLIESSGSFRTTLKAMLYELGFQRIDEARPVQEGLLDRISSRNYDLILLSHNFNDPVTGMQLLEEARFRSIMKPTSSWVLMTSDATQESVLQAIDHQPDEVLTKPFSMEDLGRRLHRICTRKAAMEPIDRAIERGALTRAVKLCDTLLSRSDPNFPAAQLTKGHLLVELQEYEAAHKLFERYYWEKREMRCGYYLALCKFHLQQISEAQQLLEELVRDYQLLIPAYELLSKIHEAQGASEKAREWLQQAVSRAPRGVQRQQELGRLAAKSGDLEVASQAYKRAIELGKSSCYDSAEPYLRLANVHRQQLVNLDGRDRQLRLQETENLLNRASRRFRHDELFSVRSQLLRGRLCTDLGRAEEADGHFQEAERLNLQLERPLDLHYEKQDVAGEADVPLLEPVVPALPEGQEKPEASGGKSAETTAEKRADPQLADKVNRTGIRHYSAGKGAQAVKSFNMAIEYDAGHASALLNLAQLYLESARDYPDKRDQRVKMLRRYLHLASRLSLTPLQQRKHQLLQTLSDRDPATLPPETLGSLLQ